MELHTLTNWIDTDILEKRKVEDFNLHNPNINKLYEINVSSLEKKYGSDNALIVYRWFGQPLYLEDIYRTFILTNSKGLQFLVCTFDRENKIDWGVGYYIYQKDKEQDFTYRQKQYPKFSITFPHSDCQKAFELFNKLP